LKPLSSSTRQDWRSRKAFAMLMLTEDTGFIRQRNRRVRYIDQNDVFAGARKIAAEQSAHRAAAKNCNLHG
jgi:hypothetical protein